MPTFQGRSGRLFLGEKGNWRLAFGLYHSKNAIEQNQSEYVLFESLRGGFFLRKKPLEDIASGYSNSGFALAGCSDVIHGSQSDGTARFSVRPL
jgi:hypothetical protein